MKVTGTIEAKLPVAKGTSANGEWAKQEFVIKYKSGNYDNRVVLNVWGIDKVNDLARYKVGETVEVDFDINAREYNGKWYNDLRAWKIAESLKEKAQATKAKATTPAPAPQEEEEDFPF